MIRHLLVASTVFIFISCGGNNSNDSNSDGKQNDSTSTTQNQSQSNGKNSAMDMKKAALGDISDENAKIAEDMANAFCECIGDSVNMKKLQTCGKEHLQNDKIDQLRKDQKMKQMKQVGVKFQQTLRNSCPDVAQKMKEIQRKQQMMRQKMQRKMQQQQGKGGPTPQLKEKGKGQ